MISGTAGSGGIVGNLTNSKSSVSNCYWIQPEAGRGNGTAPINNGKTDSIVYVLDDLGSAFVKDKNGNVILAWESSGADVPKEPKILIKGDSALSMSNDGSVPTTTLTVEYKDMDDEPTVSWTTDSDIISLTAPENAKENNAAVIVTANAPGKATVTATAGEYTDHFTVNVVPYVTTVSIVNKTQPGEVAVDQDVTVQVFTSGGAEYDYDNYPQLSYQWYKYDIYAGKTEAIKMPPERLYRRFCAVCRKRPGIQAGRGGKERRPDRSFL